MTEKRGTFWRDSRMLPSIVLLVIMIGSAIGPSSSIKIYESLTHCYRGNNTDHWSTSSLQNLLELIRKVEEAYPTSIDMRMLAVKILHELRIDGIQRAPGVKETENTIPYGVNGIMVPKFKLILNLVSDTPSQINFTEVLTPLEVCTFHRLVSSTVEPLVRGDESKTCSPNLNKSSDGQGVQCITNKVTTFPNGKVLIIPGDVSSCPEEMGVIRTFNYGSFSPGTVIAAIAAGLQPQIVQASDLFSVLDKDSDKKMELDKMQQVINSVKEINNNFVAGIVGDLAEVCVQQAPYYGENVSVGLTGYWDDMHLPKARYLVNDHYNLWQLTDSELLAGIDAYHLSMSIKSWVDRVQTLRLSQILEMFYSSRGVPTSSIENISRPRRPTGTNENADEFSHQRYANVRPPSPYYDSYYDGHNIEDSLDSACERKRIMERMSTRVFKEETFKLARVLQFSTPVIGVDDDLLYAACNTAVDRFFVRAKALLNGLPECKNIPSNYRRANVDLTMIIDGSRDEAQMHKTIGVISEFIDVSKYGSYISVVHGGSSDVLVSRTNSILQGFRELREYNGHYATSFSLSTSLSKVVQMFSAFETEMGGNVTISQKARVVLVISQGQKITDDDFKNAQWLFSGSLQQFKDVYYVFVTNDHQAFQELSRNVTKTSFVLPNQYSIIDSSDPEPKTFLPELEKILRQIPKQLIVPTCDDLESSNDENRGGPRSNEFEDYVSPYQSNNYFINPSYLHNIPELRIKFQGVGYGSFTVCMIRSSKQCQSTTITDVIQFNVSRPCQSDDVRTCSGISFTVELDSSKMRCVETDCRYPDQVRYLIRLDNVECRSDGASRPFNCAVFLLLALIMLLLNV